MNAKPLQGRAVLVTRPETQGQSLCAEIARNGGLPIHVPMLGIRPIPTSTAPEMLREYSIAIFISPNAVSYGIQLLNEAHLELQAKFLIAVGPSTARSLKQYGYREVLCPAENFSSQGVAQLKALQEDQVNGNKILIIRGSGGPETLADSLRQRGARVNYWEVYERFLPEIELSAALHATAQGHADIGIVTSLQSLKNLAGAIEAEGLNELYRLPLIVVSQRIANEVTKAGFTNPPLIVDNPDDATMIKTLTHWAMDTL